LADQGLRTLCLAYRDISIDDDDDEEEPAFEDFVLQLIVGIKDPGEIKRERQIFKILKTFVIVRPEVPHAVEQCQQAGVTVRMVTGDNLLTAKVQ
jgi:magnesium-transporting ATPase (P-type)